jgi:hypothetical protein
MTTGDQIADEDSSALLLKNHENRIAKLEETSHTTIFKRITASASASALFLGLVLTFASLHDTFVSKPEADRVNRLSEFNKAVNSAAQLRQEITKLQFESTNPTLQLAMASAVTPQILNDISTARAILKDLKNEDVGIPQLIVLITEAFTTGDTENAKVFVARAVAITDATTALRSEAKRHEGRLLYLTGSPDRGRQSFIGAVNLLGEAPATLSARSYVLADLVLYEYSFGDCAVAGAEFKTLLDTIRGVHDQSRAQIGGMVKAQMLQMQGGRCSIPQNLDALISN